jgi:hypothetical protein
LDVPGGIYFQGHGTPGSVDLAIGKATEAAGIPGATGEMTGIAVTGMQVARC